MGMFNDNKILTVFRTEQLSETDLKARYNLGIADSVSESGGITTITRKTGYIDLGDLDYTYSNSQQYFYATLSNAKWVNNSTVANAICSIYVVDTANNVITTNLHFAIGTNATLFIKNISYNNETTFKNAMKGVMLEYELLDNLAYTEQVPALQPLNTLDQNGSQWLRGEWEKGLQLWDEQWEVGSINSQGENAVSSIQIRSKNYVNVKPSSKIYFKIGSVRIGRICWYDNNKNCISDGSYYGNEIIDVPANAYYMRFVIGTGNPAITTYNHDIMLVEGNHAYPYQAYNGEIVREKEIIDFQNQLNGKQATLVNQQNIKSINGKSLLGSGNYTLEQLGIFTKPVYMNVIQLRDNNGYPVFRMGATSYSNLFSNIEVINKDYAISLIKGETCGFYRNIDDTDLYYGIVPPEFKDLVIPTTNSPDFFEIVYHDLIGVNYNDNAGGQNNFTVCFIDRSTGNITTTIINKDDIGDDQSANYYFEVYSYQVN